MGDLLRLPSGNPGMVYPVMVLSASGLGIIPSWYLTPIILIWLVVSTNPSETEMSESQLFTFPTVAEKKHSCSIRWLGNSK